MDIYTQAAILGLVEAATEFLPVSSTGHLLLADVVLGFHGPGGKVFEVVIQLGAILAIVALYFGRLWHVLVGLPKERKARLFAFYVLLAFLPAAVIGAVLHDFIKAVLFSPMVVCVSLIVGGVIILVSDRFLPTRPTVHTVESMGWRKALAIGFGQCAAMIPGVSRSGATILTALALKVDRVTATEFSFFLAIPTMVGACALDLFKARHELSDHGLLVIAVGFVVAFIAAIPVAKWLVGFVSRHGLVPFGWYRIIVGVVGLVLLLGLR